MQFGYIQFIRDNAPFLLAGALLSFLSSFGQTFFIAIFGGEIREAYGLSNGDWGLLYMIATGASAVTMVFAGGLADLFRVRSLGIGVVLALGAACIAMSVNTSMAGLVLVIFALRFFGQGMASHMAVVSMTRWFVAARGRALAVAGMGFMLGEATLPLIMVWLKSITEWRGLWLWFAVICVILSVILYRLLRLERTPQSAANETAATGLLGKHWTRTMALRHPLFWLMVPAIGFFSAFGTAFWFHQVHFAEVKGYSHLALVAVFPLGTIALAISTIIYGWAIDRFGVVRLMPLYILPYIVAFCLHWYAPNLIWTAIAVILMGISGGGNATILSACWAGFYGTRFIGSIKAAAAALMVLGSAIGPGLSGLLIDAGVGIEVQMLGYAACFGFAAFMMGMAARMANQLADAS
ncbi:MAG: MFS transporter [Yoonia sp.]|nr:MFS transporter [Yoonia sp.]